MQRALWMVGASGLLLSGCMSPVREAAPWEAALEAEASRLDEALDQVETRLLAGRTRVVLWDELAARRAQVTQIACENAEQHMEGISRHFAKTEEVMKKQKRRRAARRSAARTEAPAA
ncbi:MAG TPA: hypothetical protein VK013_13385, partial [Myxococcaceae bacterium]|nr:hypothetical protein [Myxococcaceae bacterium]